MTKSLQDIQNILNTLQPTDWIREYDGRPAVYQHDLLLSIALQISDTEFNEEWANRHPNPKAFQAKALVTYGGNLIKDVYMAVIDGGRAVLPYPQAVNNLVITQEEYNIASALNDQHILDEYLNRSKIQVM